MGMLAAPDLAKKRVMTSPLPRVQNLKSAQGFYAFESADDNILRVVRRVRVLDSSM